MLRALLLAACVAGVPGRAAADRYFMAFEGSAFGVVTLGQASLDITVEADRYRVAATIKSGGLAALFDRTDLRAGAEGAAPAGGPIAWERFDLDHSYAKKRRVTAMRPGERAMITPAFGFWGDPPPSEAQKAEARDPLSAIVAMAVQTARTGDCAGRFPVFDGRYRYDLVLRREGADRHRGGGYDGPVLKCRMQYRPVAGYRRGSDMRRRIPEGEIWFALEPGAAFAPPVRMTAPLPLGHAAIKLSRFQRATVEVGAASSAGP